VLAAALQHQLQIHLTTTHGQQLQRHQPVVDGEHLQPTNHPFKKELVNK
jgi:hypothetical protein